MKRLILASVILAALGSAAHAQQPAAPTLTAQQQIEMTLGRLVITNTQLAEQVGQLGAALEAAKKETAELKAKQQPPGETAPAPTPTPQQ